MKIKDIKERGFTTDAGGKVIDDCGNEYRNEDGEIEYRECDICGADESEYPKNMIFCKQCNTHHDLCPMCEELGHMPAIQLVKEEIIT